MEPWLKVLMKYKLDALAIFYIFTDACKFSYFIQLIFEPFCLF